MVEDRVEIGDGGVVTVQEHSQRLSVVVVMPSGDAVEMSPEEARKVVTAMIRACVAIESSPDYEPCAFSDVPDHSTGHAVRALPLIAPTTDGFVSAEEIHEGDTLVTKNGVVVGVAMNRPCSMP